MFHDFSKQLWLNKFISSGIKEPETKNGTPLINETMKDLVSKQSTIAFKYLNELRIYKRKYLLWK